jgi:cytochrome c
MTATDATVLYLSSRKAVGACGGEAATSCAVIVGPLALSSDDAVRLCWRRAGHASDSRQRFLQGAVGINQGGSMREQTLRLGLIVFCSALVATTGAAIANERGEQVFRRCQACHTLEEGGAQIRGPNLHGMFGRKAGTGSYAFSNALKESGVIWTEETLEQFLSEPRTFIPGNTMAAPAIRKPEDRRDLITYLRDATK